MVIRAIPMRSRDYERESRAEAGRLSTLFSAAVIEEMDRQGITRKDLAKRMGMSKQNIYSHLDGEKPITMLTMGKFAAGLGIYFNISVMRVPTRSGASSPARRHS